MTQDVAMRRGTELSLNPSTRIRNERGCSYPRDKERSSIFYPKYVGGKKYVVTYKSQTPVNFTRFLNKVFRCPFSPKSLDSTVGFSKLHPYF